MHLDNKKLFAITIAGLCGIIGFIFSYWLLGLLLQPLTAWFKTRLKEMV